MDRKATGNLGLHRFSPHGDLGLERARKSDQATFYVYVQMLYASSGALAVLVDVRTRPHGHDRGSEAEVIDAKGMRYLHEFPRVADLPFWQKLPRFRHPKFTCNLLADEYAPQREFTARHAVRQFKIDEASFPVHVSLYCRMKPPPPLASRLATLLLESIFR